MFEQGGEIQVTYRRHRGLPSAIGAQSADPGILVRQHRGIQAGSAHRFDQNQ
jgi:hypothetical protein